MSCFTSKDIDCNTAASILRTDAVVLHPQGCADLSQDVCMSPQYLYRLMMLLSSIPLFVPSAFLACMYMLPMRTPSLLPLSHTTGVCSYCECAQTAGHYHDALHTCHAGQGCLPLCPAARGSCMLWRGGYSHTSALPGRAANGHL